MIELDDFSGSSLPEEFFDLHALKHLKLCANYMKSLPDSLGKLTNLQHLHLSRCSDLQTLPASFGNLTKLQHVNLSWCGQLKALPSAIGDLCNLKILKLYCPLLEILPPSLCNLTNLERFSIQCSTLKCLPDSIGELKQLISLSIVDTGIEYLPALPTTLTSLEMKRIKGLSGIECLRELNNLEVLTVRECPIGEVPFASVEKAHKCMVRLKRLDLTNTRITEISFGEGVCPNLQELILNSCVELEEIGALPTTLTSLEMRYCSALNRIRGISGLRKLLELGPALETLISLEWVGICKCDKVTRIESLMTAVTHDSHIFKKLVLKLNKVAEENEVKRPEDYFLESEEDYYQESEAEDYFQESEEEDYFQESEAEDFQESGAEEN